MEELWKAIWDAYGKTYGENAQYEDGETQVFEMNDCTVILAVENGEIKLKVLGTKPIKVDYDCKFFKKE